MLITAGTLVLIAVYCLLSDNSGVDLIGLSIDAAT